MKLRTHSFYFLIPFITISFLSACTKEVAQQNYSLSEDSVDRIVVIGNKPSKEKESTFCAQNGGPIEVRGRYRGEQFSTVDTLGLLKYDCQKLSIKVQWLDSNGVFTDPSMELQSNTDANCNVTITDPRFNGNTSSGTQIRLVAAFKNNPSSALALNMKCDTPPADSISEIYINAASCYQNNKVLEVRGYRAANYFTTKSTLSNACLDMEFKVDWINTIDGTLREADMATVDANCNLMFKSNSNFLVGNQAGRSLRINGFLKANPKAVKESGLKCY